MGDGGLCVVLCVLGVFQWVVRLSVGGGTDVFEYFGLDLFDLVLFADGCFEVSVFWVGECVLVFFLLVHQFEYAPVI